MKILHVATVITPDNAYGGPIRVALNQVRHLRALGQDVDLIAGSYGFSQLPISIDDVNVRTFPAIRAIPRTGFAGLISPLMLRFLAQNAHKYDLVHIHLARDLITLPATRIVKLRNIPYVLQTHGMIDESSKRLAVILDRVLTRSLITGARTVFYLTPEEKESVKALFPAARQELLPNGVPIPDLPVVPQSDRSREVLYLARLQKRKRPLDFVEAARAVLRTLPNVTFSLVGPDEGEATRVNHCIQENALQGKVEWQGPVGIGDTLHRMSQANIYVLPSVNEPFPMSVLEAMSLGLPVIVRRSNGLASAIEENKAGIVADEDAHSLADAIHALLDDDKLRIQMGSNARQLVIDRYSIQSVVASLLHQYKLASSGAYSAPHDSSMSLPGDPS